MGCTQSKTAKDAVAGNANGNPAKGVSSVKPTEITIASSSSPTPVQPSDLTTSHTVSSDDHDGALSSGVSKDSVTTENNTNSVEESLTKNHVADNSANVDTPKRDTHTTNNVTTIMTSETTVALSESIEITTSATNNIANRVDTPTAVDEPPTKNLASTLKNSPLQQSDNLSSDAADDEVMVKNEDKEATEEPKQPHERPTMDTPGEPVLIKEQTTEIETVAVLDKDENAETVAEEAEPPVSTLEERIPLEHIESTIEVVALEKEDSVSNANSFSGEHNTEDADTKVSMNPKITFSDITVDSSVSEKKIELDPAKSSSKQQPKYCVGCFVEEISSGAFKFCAKCKTVSYCSRDCQVQHWKVHKKVCGKSGVLDAGKTSIQVHDFAADESSFVETSVLKSTSREDAVKELEAVLRRLRSEESQEEDQPTFEIVALDDDNKPKEEEPDPVETARESILDETVSEMLESGLFGEEIETEAPKSPKDIVPPPPSVDENTPILLQVPEVRTCAGCSSVEKAMGAFKSCAKCRVVFYCNRKCQKSHWKEHKKSCCKSDPNASRKSSLLLQAKDTSLTTIQAS
ncbi:MYND domain protein [Seminavis robusta]|uniref:MYND domain protein n=1 Tax=Seminavis robusta TaxID=568900 RepID=A0A9N8EKF1_9STRA|nr:MYND domain protein [Seminavis robusta]|eukprot:Sro1409_g270190.1 MYND domain protein (576) ;mRNA; f:14212-15939